MVQTELLVASLERSSCSPWDNTNGIGCNFGIAEDARSGTLGGYLNLTKSGVVTSVAMTCHHILSSGSERKWLESSKEHLLVAPEQNLRSDRANSLEPTVNRCISAQ